MSISAGGAAVGTDQISGYPGGRNGMWTATCDLCGKRMNGLYANEAQAMKPLVAHVKDVHPQEER